MQAILGKVVSNKMQNAVVVAVDRLVPHPKYHKRMRKHTKYHAYTTEAIPVGNMVKIVPCKPVSKTITWRVVEKIA